MRISVERLADEKLHGLVFVFDTQKRQVVVFGRCSIPELSLVEWQQADVAAYVASHPSTAREPLVPILKVVGHLDLNPRQLAVPAHPFPGPDRKRQYCARYPPSEVKGSVQLEFPLRLLLRLS